MALASVDMCRYAEIILSPIVVEKVFVDAYEAKKSVCRYFMKQGKVFVDAYEAISQKVFVDGQKSVCRLLKKKCSSTIYYITLRKISAFGSEARHISHNKVQTFFCLTT